MYHVTFGKDNKVIINTFIWHSSFRSAAECCLVHILSHLYFIIAEYFFLPPVSFLFYTYKQ